MFIQNAVWSSVNIANLEAPLLEGTVLDKDGQIVFVPGEGGGGKKSLKSIIMQAPYGIVPETVSVFPPTMMVNVCIGGTINIDLPGNEVMNDFTNDIMTQLGEDFNFVKFNEHTGGGGDNLPHYDDNDIGKVLTVGSEYETTGEAIQMQSVELVNSVGALDAQKVDASKWTDGQWVSVTYNDTVYTRQIYDAEGELVLSTDDFTLVYDSSTGVMSIEAVNAESPVTVSAQYLTEHAHADWAEPSGGSGSGDSILFVKPTGTVHAENLGDVIGYFATTDKSVSEINAASGVKPVFVCFPDVANFTNDVNPIISFESSHVYPVTDFVDSHYSFSIGAEDVAFVFDYNPPVSQFQNVYVIAMMATK